MRDDTSKVTAEWAVEGKQAGSRDDYAIVACSRGRLGLRVFEEIRARYSTGTPEDLPQVTIAFVYGSEDAHVVLAIRKWSDQEDGTGRRISRTRYFCVPYAQLTGLPPSYENLYHAFDPWDPATGDPSGRGGPYATDVRMLDPKTIAERVTPTAMGAAALLMTGDPVCVVSGEAVPLIERLRFLDTVAALLPYGMRAKLTASTWTSSTSEHNIKFSFAKYVPDGMRSIAWGTEAQISQGDPEAYRYLSLLAQCTRLADLIDWLACATDPLSFGEKGRSRALELLDDFFSQAVPSVESIATDEHAVSKLLVDCVDGVQHGKHRTLNRIIGTLDGVIKKRGGVFGQDEQAHYRGIINDGRLLASEPPVNLEAFYYVLLSIGYGPRLTFQDFRHIGQAVPRWPTALLKVMMRMTDEPIVGLLVADELGEEELNQLFLRLQTRNLIEAVTRIPDNPKLFEKIFAELQGRGGGDGAADPAMAEGLREHDYLVDAVGSYVEPGNAQFLRYCRLLKAAYGEPLGQKEFEEILGSMPGLNPRTGPLLAAAVDLHGGGGWTAIATAVMTVIESSRLGPETRKDVLGLLAQASPEASVADESPSVMRRLSAFSWEIYAIAFAAVVTVLGVVVLHMLGIV